MRLRYVALFPVIESISCQSLWRKQRATTGGSLSLNASDSPSAIDAASNHQVGTLERRTYVSRASCSEAGAEMIDLALGEVVEWTRWAWLALSEHRDPFEAMAVRQILGHPTPDEEVRAKNRYAMIEREARLLTRGSTLIDCLDPTGRCSSAPEVEGYVDTQLSRIHLCTQFFVLPVTPPTLYENSQAQFLLSSLSLCPAVYIAFGRDGVHSLEPARFFGSQALVDLATSIGIFAKTVSMTRQ